MGKPSKELVMIFLLRMRVTYEGDIVSYHGVMLLHHVAWRKIEDSVVPVTTFRDIFSAQDGMGVKVRQTCISRATVSGDSFSIYVFLRSTNNHDGWPHGLVFYHRI